MITTRQINVTLDKGGKKLQQATTKDVDASIVEHFDVPKIIEIDGILQEMPEEFELEIPKRNPPQSISTKTLADVADIAVKKKRGEIMAQRKAFLKSGTKVDGKDLEKLNMQFVFVEIDDLVQGISRRELK